jgi:hypothetical protein
MENQQVQEVQVQEVVQKVKKVRTPSVDATNFVMVWQQNKGDVNAVHAKIGGNKQHIRHRANQLIKKGVPLIPPKSFGGGGRLNLDELAALANTFMTDE